jgi:lipid-A-disaccharide synthase
VSPRDNPRILLVAGEASGDLRGAELVRELRAILPDVEVFGIGGEKLRAAGMEVLLPASELSIMGITEVVGRLRIVLQAFRRLRDAIRGEAPDVPRPDLVILIDFPDFNLRLAVAGRRAGVPVLYYVSPQVWAWRRYRINTLARWVDHLAVVFPFEEEIYRGRAAVTFVGHPALETVHATRSRDEVRRDLGLTSGRPMVALLPGSRKAEVRLLLPVLRDALPLLGRPVDAVIALAEESLREEVAAIAPDVPAFSGETYDLVAAADVVLVASGSASLETALLGQPMVIVYRVSPVTYALARLLVKVPFFGMPNLILGKRAVPELLQGDATPERVAAEARAILDDPELAAQMRADLASVRSRLGEPGAARRAAEIAVRMLDPIA